MRERVISIIGAVVVFLFVGYLLFLGVDLSYLTTELAVGLFFLGIGIIWWGFRSDIERWIKKKPDMRKLDPRLEHVEACLFYPPEYRNKKKIFQRRHKPIYELVLLTDSHIAFYLGEYVRSLILNGKINLHTEYLEKKSYDWYKAGEKNALVLVSWMRWNGYHLIERVANESDLLLPFAKAVILDKKKQYRRGEMILFWTYYRGELTNGFFSNQIFAPEGQVFPNTKLNRVPSWAPDTLESGDPNIFGKLNGYATHKSQWSWNIPLDAPLGRYRVYMRVHNHFTADSRPVVYEKEDTFVVTEALRDSVEPKDTIEKVNKKPVTESSKQQDDLPIICAVEFESFDQAFEAVQEASDLRAEATMLDYFQEALRDLCYNHDWNQVEGRIEKVFDYIPKKLSNEPNALRFVQFIAMIVNRFAEQTRDKIGEKWLDELEKLYSDPRYETDSNVLYVTQELVQYDVEYLKKLIDDASTRWSDSRFQALAAHIGFSELKKRNKEAYKDILRYLLGKMNDAGRNKEEKSQERLVFLYNRARVA
jgi:molybdopterin-guanine dinucleotide biosynthesis protein A